MSDASAIKPSLSKNIEETREKLSAAQASQKTDMDEKAISILTGSTLKTLRMTSPANSQGDTRKPVAMPEVRATKSPEHEQMETESVLALAPSNTMTMNHAWPMARVGTIIGVVLTIAWFVLCVGYVNKFIGFQALAQLQPHLLGGFLAGVMAPVAMLWMAMTYIQRGSDVHMYADALRAELQAMIFPSEERSQIIHKDIETLCRQSAELSAASKTVLKSIQRARLGLRAEINDLTGMSKKAEFHIDRLSETLHERSAKLLTLTDEIDVRSSALDKRSKEKTVQWEEQSQSLLTRAQEMEISLDKGAQRLEGAADKVTRTAGIVSSITDAAQTISRTQQDMELSVQGLADKVSNVTSILNGSFENVEKSVVSMMDKAGGLEGLMGEKTEGLKNAVDVLDKRIQSIETIGQEAATRMSDSMSVALSGAEAMSAAARRAVEQLMRAATEQRIQNEDVLKEITAHIEKMQGDGKSSGENLKNLVSLMNDSRQQLEQSMALTDRHVEKLNRAVEEQLSRIAQAEMNLTAKSEKISDVLMAPIHTIERAVERAETCHSAIGDTLTQRVADLSNVSDKAASHVNAIRDSMREQARELTTLSGQVAGYSRALSENLSRHRTEIEGTVKSSLANMEEATSALGSHSSKLMDTTQLSEGALARLKESMMGHAGAIMSSTHDVLSGLSALDGKLEGRVVSLREGSVAASNAIVLVTEALNATANGFEPIYQRAIDRAQSATTMLERLKNGFDDTAESNLNKLKTIGVVFDEKLETLKFGADEAAKLLKSSGEFLQARSTDIQSAAQEVSRRMTDIGHTLASQASDIHLAADQAVMRVEVVRKAVDGQFQDISASVDQTLVQFKNSGDEFTRQMSVAKAVAESALSGFDRAGNLAREQSASLREQAAQVAGTTLKLVEAVNEKAEFLLNSSTTTMTDLKRTGESFALKSHEVSEHMKSALRTAEKYTGELAKHTDAVADASMIAADKISGAMSQLSVRMDKMGGHAEDVTAKISMTGEKLAEQSSRLVAVSAKALQAAEDTSATFVRESTSLFRAAQVANEQAEKIKSEDGKAQRQAFFTTAKFVIESLHSLSIDITRLGEGEISEKSWKLYQKGDLGAFTRRLADMGDKMPLEKMRQKYAQDTEFRTYVGRFIRHFEDLYDQASATDQGDLMAMTFGTSDMGKLYQALCQAAGREAKTIKPFGRVA